MLWSPFHTLRLKGLVSTRANSIFDGQEFHFLGADGVNRRTGRSFFFT